MLAGNKSGGQNYYRDFALRLIVDKTVLSQVFAKNRYRKNSLSGFLLEKNLPPNQKIFC